MKTKNILGTIALLFIALPIFAIAPPSVGVVTKVIQEVEYKAVDTDNWDDAKIGGVLSNGDEIRTGQRSLALLKYLDNSLLRIRENSIVTVYGTKEESKLDKNTVIQQGTVGFEVSKQEGEEFKFTTPTGVASIRGTSGFFDVQLDGEMLLYVEEGLIEILSLLGSKESNSVGSGQVARINSQGDLSVEDASDEISNRYNTLTKDESKKIRIKLDTGEEYILEYLE